MKFKLMSKDTFKEILFFRRMIMSSLVQVLFWIGVLGAITTGIMAMFQGAIIQGITYIIFGPFLIRLICEYLIVLFRINDTLADINDRMRERGGNLS